MTKKIILPVVLVAALAAGAYYLQSRSGEENARGWRVSGNIEASVAQLGFKIAGRLQTREVDEGARVEAGQRLARLDPTDQHLQVAQARANLAYAEAALAELEAGSRAQEIAGAEAELARALAGERAAQAELRLAEQDEARFRELRDKGTLSRREYQVYRTRYDAALNAYRETGALVRGAREVLSLRQEGARRETLDKSRAQVEVAREALHVAEQQLRYTDLAAPFTGVVLSKSAEPGEYLNPGAPVLSLGKLDQVWLRAYVSAADLGRVALGRKCRVRADAWPDRDFPGTLSYIAGEAEFTPKTVQTFEERISLMYRVKITLDNPDLALKPGMPADAWFE